MIRTISFLETKAILRSLLGRESVGDNFNEFIMAYRASLFKLFDVVNRATSHDGITDFTNEILKKENDWLFSREENSAIEIIIRHLNSLNNGDKTMPTWCFLDCSKKAVVHFVNKKEWYAEVYFPDHVDSSFLHLVEQGNKNIIAVTFAKNMNNAYVHTANAGGYFLHDYLPREKLDILGRNKSGRGKKTSSLAKQNHHKDEGDKL